MNITVALASLPPASLGDGGITFPLASSMALLFAKVANALLEYLLAPDSYLVIGDGGMAPKKILGFGFFIVLV